MLLTELPLGLPGRIFGGPMPFGDYDPEGEVLSEFRQKEISVSLFFYIGQLKHLLRIRKGASVMHMPRS